MAVQMVYVFSWVLCILSLLFLAPACFMKHFCIGPLLSGTFLAVAVVSFVLMLPYATQASLEGCSSDDEDSLCTSFWGSTDDMSWHPVAGFWLAIATVIVLFGGGGADVLHALLTTRKRQVKEDDLESGNATTYNTFAPSNTAPPSRAPPLPPTELIATSRSSHEEEDPYAVAFNPEDMENAIKEGNERQSLLQKALSPRANTVAVLEKKRLKRYLKYLRLPEDTSQDQWLAQCARDGRPLEEAQAKALVHWCGKHGAKNHLGIICAKLLCALAYPAEKMVGIREKILSNGAWRVLLNLATKGELRLHRFISKEHVCLEQELARGSGGKVFLASWTPQETMKCGGVVFLAEQEYTVAVKVCQEGGIPFTTKEEFLFEAGIMSMLSHRNVLPCYGANELDDELFVVMPLARYGSLLSMLTDFEGKPLETVPMKQKAQWALDIALAMEYLHKWDIVYRDLKACNILVDSEKRCLLSDFGISRTVDRRQRMTMRQGTTAWMAPEMLTGEGNYTQAVDVYSFGILLYELVTQKRPFFEVDSFALPDRVLEGLRPDVPTEATEPIRSLMQECWATNPHERPSFKSIVATLQSAT